MGSKITWERHKVLFVEAFVAANFAFLTLDIYWAHSSNSFRYPTEWIPFYFSALAAVFLFLVEVKHRSSHRLWRRSGFAVGMVSILVGITGMLFHLSNVFFNQATLKSLVYTAPFAAPLAYVGLGFVLLLNRMVDTERIEWGQWLLFFSLGGFFANFVLSLCDHAQNGFFHAFEWIPVGSSALAVGFLSMAVLNPQDQNFLRSCMWMLVGQFVVGLLGFGFHFVGDLPSASGNLLENIIYKVPLLAPLLFVNLSVLAWFGLRDLVGQEATSIEVT